jgi:hypothetical protein
LVECCIDGCPSGRFSHLHRGTMELCHSDQQVLVTSLNKALLPRLLCWRVVPNVFHSRMMGGHCVLVDLQYCRIFLVPFPRSVPWHNPVSELYRQFLWSHGLVFALTCAVNCGTLYRKVCAQIGHNQLNLLQVDSNQVVETSQGWSMETGCTWA